MNKRITVLSVVILLLSVCILLAACAEPSKNKTPAESGQTATGQQGNETKPSGGEEHNTTPTVESGTQVGSGRGEAGNDAQEETTTPTTESTESTEPTESTVPTTPETVPDDALNMTYQEYMALSTAEQQAFYDKYFADDPLGFAAWFQKIKQAYDDETPEIIATGPVDIGDYIDP